MRAPAEVAAPSWQSALMRFLVRSWEYQHPQVWVRVRIACGVFNVALGVLLLASFRWLGSLTWLAVLPLAGAVLIFWTVYHLQEDSALRVRELEQSRARVVDDSAARLRRIERDLHDGAQAQLVAVAMKLGLAKEKLGSMATGPGRPTWTGSRSSSMTPTAAPSRPSPTCATWPAASTRRCSTTASPPRSPPSPRAATCPSSCVVDLPERPVGRDRDHRLLLRRRVARQRRQAQRRPAGHAGGG